MRKTYLLLSLLLAVTTSFGGVLADSDKLITGPGDDPISLSKKIIAEKPEPWQEKAMNSILSTYGTGYNLVSNDEKYVLLESPGMAFDCFKIGFEDMRESIPKALLIKMMNQAVENPAPTSTMVAKATIDIGLREYQKAYEIAAKFKETNSLNYEEAITFLENRYGYHKLDHALKLVSNDLGQSAAADKKSLKKIYSKIKEIEKKYPSEIAWKDALPLLEEWYGLLEGSNAGLSSITAYRDFKKAMDKLNQKRVKERLAYRSTIKITYPKAGVTWMAPSEVSLKWQSTNIDPHKKIRFFLIKDDVVIQDLGIYDNSKAEDGIRLDRGLPNGNNYRVMGIEQNPVNRYQVAKFATPFFTIKKAPRKEKQPVAATTPPAPKPKPIPVPPPVETVEKEEVPAEPVAVKEEVPLRMEFDGRSISYRKELEVSTDEIRISLWDHGRKDGDLVSIYVNGEAVVYKHSLEYRKSHFDIKLKKGTPNDLFLYAHNLGRFPPNTVAIEIVDNEGSENIVLNSDLKSCEAVLINVKQ
ncbi:hypothetical protein [Poritiphilus flavus]|uniref:Uncharacterized protein n=1 Tax=Poritiphilus flavus TaxID=2697053 RepID=A0A6L9EFQ7_9FLAO|nr:hypothetical protein [Poritiphilus flavus]NAS13595.1 hypothetical protein [Poritiphilus flavus]